MTRIWFWSFFEIGKNMISSRKRGFLFLHKVSIFSPVVANFTFISIERWRWRVGATAERPGTIQPAYRIASEGEAGAAWISHSVIQWKPKWEANESHIQTQRTKCRAKSIFHFANWVRQMELEKKGGFREFDSPAAGMVYDKCWASGELEVHSCCDQGR